MLTIAAVVAVEPSDENTPSGGHFYYRMRGFDEAGSSTYTNEVLVIVQN